jgi:hypothetical protein
VLFVHQAQDLPLIAGDSAFSLGMLVRFTKPVEKHGP